MEDVLLLGHNDQAKDDSEDTQSNTEGSRDTLTPNSVKDSSTPQGSAAKTDWSRSSRIVTKPGLFSNVEDKNAYEKRCGYDTFVVEKPGDYAAGFPRLAVFTAYDKDWSMFRRFQVVHNRFLLHEEVELTRLEAQLNELDRNDALREAEAMATGDWKGNGDEFRLRYTKHEEGWNEDQKNLLAAIRPRLVAYSEMLLSQARMEALAPAPKRDHRSYFNYIRTSDPKLLAKGYDDFARHGNDMVMTKPKSANELRSFILDLADTWCQYPVVKWLLGLRIEDDGDGSPEQKYYSDAAMNRIVAGTLSTVCVIILLVPSYVLFLVQMNRPVMAVTASVFVIVFALLLSSTPGADTYKVLVGTATFGALVGMFLGGNITPGNGGCTQS